MSDRIGLDLFNDDTCPSGHISRPTHVYVSELLSLSKQITQARWYGLSLRASWSKQIPSDLSDSSDQMYRMSDHSYQIEESRFSLELNYASLGDCLKESSQRVSCVVFITTFLYHCTLQEHVVNAQCLTTVVKSSLWSSGQDMWLGGLGMANSKSGDYNLFSCG